LPTAAVAECQIVAMQALTHQRDAQKKNTYSKCADVFSSNNGCSKSEICHCGLDPQSPEIGEVQGFPGQAQEYVYMLNRHLGYGQQRMCCQAQKR